MELLRTIEGFRSPFLDTVVELITRLGEQTIAIVILCVIFWAINKRWAYIMGTSFFLSGLVVQGAKIVFRVPRPWIADPTLNPVYSALERATGYSFPSGHTQAASALFFSLSLSAYMKQKVVAYICFAIPVLVAFSRIYLGVHTVFDVAVSLLVSFIIVHVVAYQMREEAGSRKKNIIFSGLLLIIAIKVIIIALTLYHTGRIDFHNVSDSLKISGASIGFAIGMFIEREYIKFPEKARSLAAQIVKCVIGIGSVLTVQEILRWNFEPGLFNDMFRYFVIIIWITVIYPLAIKRFFPAKEEK